MGPLQLERGTLVRRARPICPAGLPQSGASSGVAAASESLTVAVPTSGRLGAPLRPAVPTGLSQDPVMENSLTEAGTELTRAPGNTLQGHMQASQGPSWTADGTTRCRSSCPSPRLDSDSGLPQTIRGFDRNTNKTPWRRACTSRARACARTHIQASTQALTHKHMPASLPRLTRTPAPASAPAA